MSAVGMEPDQILGITNPLLGVLAGPGSLNDGGDAS
jgi:hypothetical protein